MSGLGERLVESCGPGPAEAAWYDREGEYVDRAVELIRVYQFKMPDGIGPYRDPSAPWPKDWWAAFWESLEADHVVEQRREYIRRWIERNAPGGRQGVLSRFLEMNPRWCPYIPHGQQTLEDFEGVST